MPAEWPPEVVAEVVAEVGPPPAGVAETLEPTEWDSGALRCRYEPLAAGAVLGEGSHWPHVFAVMKALADRFGADGVRRVVAFD